MSRERNSLRAHSVDVWLCPPSFLHNEFDDLHVLDCPISSLSLCFASLPPVSPSFSPPVLLSTPMPPCYTSVLCELCPLPLPRLPVRDDLSLMTLHYFCHRVLSPSHQHTRVTVSSCNEVTKLFFVFSLLHYNDFFPSSSCPNVVSLLNIPPFTSSSLSFLVLPSHKCSSQRFLII